jgi:creatinine amidohydrolase
MTMEARFLTSSDYAALVKETDLALVPLGAVEVYGPHLPMGADGIATEALAKRVAAEVPAIIAPLRSRCRAIFSATAGERTPTIAKMR